MTNPTIQYPKITWAALFTIAGLVFSTGAAWNKTLDMIEVNQSQWRMINKHTDQIAATETKVKEMSPRVDLVVKELRYKRNADKALAEAVIRLTVAVENWEKESTKESGRRLDSEHYMQSLSEKINSIEVKIGKIEAKIK